MTGADQVVVLQAGNERYAVPLDAVERVHTVESVTLLPGLRPPWRGLVYLRGEILPALDLQAYLGRPSASPGPLPAAVGAAVVGHGELRVALLSEAPVVLASSAAGGVAVDVAGILADPALVVNG